VSTAHPAWQPARVYCVGTHGLAVAAEETRPAGMCTCPETPTHLVLKIGMAPRTPQELLRHLGSYRLLGVLPPEVTGVSYHSARVNEGEVFCALRGRRDDGHRHLSEARERGASVAVVEAPVDVDLPQVVVPNSRGALGLIAAAWYGFPSRRIAVIGVTGTNGKTTTAFLLRSILAADGNRVGLVSSVGYSDGESTLRASHTTPEAPVLQRLLASMRDNHLRYAVVEVSSHALALHRVTGTTFAVVVYTNLSRDHLDFHGTMTGYLEAKARLLRMLSPSGVAVVCADDPWWAQLPISAAPRLLTYSPTGRAADVRCIEHRRCDGAVALTITKGSLRAELTSRLTASFNRHNFTAAAAAALTMGIAPDQVARGVADLTSVPGRFQRVCEGQPFPVVVDYAHTPDALARCLDSARREVDGKLIVVFGCGGDRDEGKRPLMADVASRLADAVIQTSDNPRREDPRRIFRQVEGGLRAGTDYRLVPVRSMALRRAAALARPGDVVVAAGKGHERRQLLQQGAVPFREEIALRRALKDLGYGHSQRPNPYRGKKVLVVGLARAGAGAALLLARDHAQVVGTDLREAPELDVGPIREAGVELHLGAHLSRLPTGVDLIVASPGVLPENPLLTQARGRGIPVVDELEISSRLWEGPLLVVTGTNGKTTTTRLLGHLLKSAGLDPTVAGNVGFPLSAALLADRGGVGIVEASSFQLERSPSLHPRVALVLNLAPDHLDRHKTFGEYIAAKARIAANLTARDYLVYNSGDSLVRAMANTCRGQLCPFGALKHRHGAYTHRGRLWLNVGGEPEVIMELSKVPLQGVHNALNVLAASLAAGLLGVDPEVMRDAILRFRASGHRLEVLAEVDGALFVNDSKATNLHATEWALRSLERPVVLIAGGVFKGGSTDRLVRLIRRRCRLVVLMGEDAIMLYRLLRGAAPTRLAADLHEAVATARGAARPGDAVLLSPACASFDMFRDYEDRGEQFRQEVRLLLCH
jgi:UDP-N-acetylmuramoyl-L-alanyl-D-glutamate--2,6-diaminopimelate ligase